MNRLVTPRRLATAAALTVAWCALWRDVSAANLLAGFALSVAVLALGVGTAGAGGIRPTALLRLLWLVAVDLVTSTVDVARAVVAPGDRTDECIVAYQLPPDAQAHLLLLVVAITVTPGTAVVDADPDAGVIYLHLLHGNRRADVEAHVGRLARLVVEALPTGTPTATSGARA